MSMSKYLKIIYNNLILAKICNEWWAVGWMFSLVQFYTALFLRDADARIFLHSVAALIKSLK